MEILSQNLPEEDRQNGTSRTIVIEHSISLLLDIHRAFAEPISTIQEDVISHDRERKGQTLVEDAKRRRALHALLDLLAFEGIYPSLSEGVGIPLEQRMVSVLPTGVVAKQASRPSDTRAESENLLRRILENLLSILRDKRDSIQPIILGRILPDIITGAAELGFNSQCMSHQDVDTYKDIFCDIINEYVYSFYGLA